MNIIRIIFEFFGGFAIYILFVCVSLLFPSKDLTDSLETSLVIGGVLFSLMLVLWAEGVPVPQ